MIPKFRAWSKQYKKMIDEVNDMTFFEGNLEFIGCRTANGVSFQYCADDIILMQSTGLFDKNSKEIFEGDILGTKDGLLNGVVEYRADLGMFVNSLIRYNNFERLCNIGSDREIISNIYENPELLGGNRMKKVTFLLGHRGEKIEYISDRENIIDEIEYHFRTNQLFEIKLKDRTVLLNLRDVIFTEIEEVEE